MYIRPQRMTVSALLAQYAQGELDFPGAHIDHADLRHVCLDNVNLCGARLPGADARGIHLSGAYLSFINLFGADLEAADLCDSDLGYADLRCANLMGRISRRKLGACRSAWGGHAWRTAGAGESAWRDAWTAPCVMMKFHEDQRAVA